MAVQFSTLPLITIANGGTRIRLYETDLWVTDVTIQAGFSNVSKLNVGDSTVTSTTGIEIPAGDTASLSAPQSRHLQEEFNLYDIYIVSATTNDTCRVSAFKRKP